MTSEQRITQLENMYLELVARVTKLEYNNLVSAVSTIKTPQFTPGTIPSPLCELSLAQHK